MQKDSTVEHQLRWDWEWDKKECCSEGSSHTNLNTSGMSCATGVSNMTSCLVRCWASDVKADKDGSGSTTSLTGLKTGYQSAPALRKIVPSLDSVERPVHAQRVRYTRCWLNTGSVHGKATLSSTEIRVQTTTAPRRSETCPDNDRSHWIAPVFQSPWSDLKLYVLERWIPANRNIL